MNMTIDLNAKIPGCKDFSWKEVFQTSYDTHKNFNEFNQLPEAKKFEVFCNIIAVANRLQGARDFLGFPIPIESWYRSPRVDSIVGGAGVHTTGACVDPKLSTTRLKEFCSYFKNNSGGLGVGEEQAHIDVLLTPSPRRRWTY